VTISAHSIFYDGTKPHLRALILGQRDSPTWGLCARPEATEPPPGRSRGTHCRARQRPEHDLAAS
jgi:hypothetical protein